MCLGGEEAGERRGKEDFVKNWSECCLWVMNQRGLETPPSNTYPSVQLAYGPCIPARLLGSYCSLKVAGIPYRRCGSGEPAVTVKIEHVENTNKLRGTGMTRSMQR